NTFFGDSSLTSIVIHDGVTQLPNGTFYGCQLTAVVLPDGLTLIGNGAFYGNELTTVSIPSTVTRIEENAFANNSSLDTVSVYAVTPPYLDYGSYNIFYGHTPSVIYVPAVSVTAYKTAAGWSDYAAVIQAGSW
ncbi:MAG TPA: leucine-rich repeat domain-containing protein, partial [Spirochaetia bacterium]